MHRTAGRFAARAVEAAANARWWVVAVGFAAVLSVALSGLVGCAGAEQTDDEPAASSEARQAEGPGESEAEGGSLADSAAAAARQLEDAMARAGADAGDAGQRVEWVETWPRDGEQGPDGQREPADGPATPPDSETETETATEAEADADVADEPAHDEAPASDQDAAADAREPATPGDLLNQLLGHVRNADEPTIRRALTAATLRAAVGDASLDPYLLGTLGYTQRRAVERYQRMLLTMLDQLGASEASLDRATLLEGIDALFEHEPVEIRKLVLCREVSGYGIYEPFEQYRFLAGERQRVILYVELDHFRARQLGDGRYEVNLQQQVVLYNEADGLAVWRHDPVQITDVSRNRRRDFFIVQLITLPERLNVGNYRLKVRVTDEHGGSIDETTTRIQLLADENLLAEQDEGGG